jgi:DNA-binding CsgD family transcriptional regulator
MDLIDLGTASPDDANRGVFLDQLCQKLELDFASYATQHPVTGAVQGYANYPDEWKHYYTRQNLQRVDPTLWRSVRSIAPVDWERFADDAGFASVFHHSCDFGIPAQGLTVPVRGPMGDCGLLSVTRACSREEWRKLKRSIIGELQSAAVHFHDAVMRSDTVTALMKMPAVSAREREILQWIAAGKSQQDIGDILSISHRTVEVHIRSVREKLGALTTPQAVGRAVRLGLISPC